MFVYWVLFSFFFVVVKLKCWWQFSQLITHADIDLIIRNVYSELNTSSHSSIDFVSTANDLAAAQLMSSIPSRVISNYYICVWKIRWSFSCIDPIDRFWLKRFANFHLYDNNTSGGNILEVRGNRKCPKEYLMLIIITRSPFSWHRQLRDTYLCRGVYT